MDGKPIGNENGHARWTACFNERGELIEKAFYGEDGHPKADKQGRARITWQYDEAGNIIGHTNYDVNGHPIEHTLLRMETEASRGKSPFIPHGSSILNGQFPHLKTTP